MSENELRERKNTPESTANKKRKYTCFEWKYTEERPFLSCAGCFFIWKIKSTFGLEFRSAIRNKIDSHAEFYFETEREREDMGRVVNHRLRVRRRERKKQLEFINFSVAINSLTGILPCLPIRIHPAKCYMWTSTHIQTSKQTNAHISNTHITHYHKLQHYYSGRH